MTQQEQPRGADAGTDDDFDDGVIAPEPDVDPGDDLEDGSDDELRDPAGSFAVLEDAAAREIVEREYGDDDDFLGYESVGSPADLADPLDDESALGVLGDPSESMAVVGDDEADPLDASLGATDPDLVDDAEAEDPLPPVLDDQEIEDALRFEPAPAGAELTEVDPAVEGAADPTVQSEDFGGNSLIRPDPA